MSLDEQNQAYGRIMSDYIDAKKKLVALESEAKKITDVLSGISESLKMPALIAGNNYFENQLANYPTPEKLREIFTDIITIREKKIEAEKQLRELGFDAK